MLSITTFPAEEKRSFSINDGRRPKQRALPNVIQSSEKYRTVFIVQSNSKLDVR
jgi:hypothetical protein